jgi:copper(I)-binding protein
MRFDPGWYPARVASRRFRGLAAPAGTALILLAMSGCSSGQSNAQDVPSAPFTSGRIGGVVIREAWIPAPIGRVYPTGSGVVVDVQLRNLSPTWDMLASGSTPVSPRVTVSQFNITQDFISLPTYPELIDGVVQLHGITRPLAPGEVVPVTLDFKEAGPLTLQIPVRAQLRGPTFN